MHRARLATLNALSFALLAVSVVLAAQGAASSAVPSTANVVGWPVSSLLLSEVQTGGASASDEFVELTNAGRAAVDLVGLEIAYVTSTGGTIDK
jgi:hypothetical protein